MVPRLPLDRLEARLFGCGGGVLVREPPGSVEAISGTDTAEIEAVLRQYVRAIDNADQNLLREVWEPGDSASYINPRQRLRTWAELGGFWEDFLRNSFSQREFTPAHVTVRQIGDVAWVVFDWEFRATRNTGQPYNQRGWESQVYRKTNHGWRIAHVQYAVAGAER